MDDISIESLIADIVEWASIETPTDQPASVNNLVSHVEMLHRNSGWDVERIDGTSGRGDKLVARAPWGDPGEPGILVISHLDTVHPLGTLEQFPVRRQGDRLEGPGVFDMKGGACMALEAARAIIRSNVRPHLPVTFLYVPDEEMGSQTSRDIIDAHARRAKYVLVAEGSEQDGVVVTSRTGSLKFDLEVTGVAAHSGGNHSEGRSALRELAHQILILENMTDYSRDITVNVGTAFGGTRANVVPEKAGARVDIRVSTPGCAEEMLARIRELAAVDPDVSIRYRGDIWRRPYVRTDGIARLYDTANRLAGDLGLALEETKSRGGSDANLVADFVPVLDGLGPLGGGAHTRHEWIDLATICQRTALLKRLMATLE